MKLVEQELWQREEKGLIGVLPVRDPEAAAVDSILSPGEPLFLLLLLTCLVGVKNLWENLFIS